MNMHGINCLICNSYLDEFWIKLTFHASVFPAKLGLQCNHMTPRCTHSYCSPGKVALLFQFKQWVIKCFSRGKIGQNERYCLENTCWLCNCVYVCVYVYVCVFVCDQTSPLVTLSWNISPSFITWYQIKIWLWKYQKFELCLLFLLSSSLFTVFISLPSSSLFTVFISLPSSLFTDFFYAFGFRGSLSDVFFPPLSFFSAFISASRDVTTHLWVGVGSGVSCSRRY